MLDTRQITSFRQLNKENAELYGDKTAFIYKENKEEKTISYKQYYDNMNYLGTAFAELGIMGETIAVIGDAHPGYLVAYFAATMGGGVIVPLDKEIADEEIVKFLNICEAKAIVYTEKFNNRLANYKDKLPHIKYFIPIHSDTEKVENEYVLPYAKALEIGKAALEGGNRSFIDYECDVEKLAAIIFTSGTTGTSKGVMLSQRNICSCSNAAAQIIDYLTPDFTLISVLPMNHTYETATTYFAGSVFGVTIFMNDSLKYTLQNFKKYKPTLIVLVPLFIETMHKKIWEEIRKKGLEKKVRAAMKLSNGLRKIGIDLRRKLFKEILDAFGGELRYIISGGAPLNAEYIKTFDAIGINIQEGYGITECSPLVSVNPFGKEKLCSVGPPVSICEVKIDKENETDETGEILVKGPNVMLGYYKNPEATAACMTEDGFFRTGDIGYLDKDGYIYITGRKKNVIILSNGKNIFPEEIEEYLATSELFAESVVIGRENANKEVVITALIYPNQEYFKDKTKEEIYEACKQEVNKINRKLPTFKHINEIEIRDTEFEKTPSRKIKRYLLK